MTSFIPGTQSERSVPLYEERTGKSPRIEAVRIGLPGYTVERELGRGGMATVYLAHDKKHNRKVAIKVLHAEVAAVLGAERFLQEIQVTANLQHPHILGLIDSGAMGDDAGDLKGRPYYVMPYVNGESLRQLLDKEQQLSITDSVRIATQVASALDYAHRNAVIHRDIKPENILLQDGSAIVADFGIALALTRAGGERITESGLSLGTPAYMSPEQGMGERTITARSDIYSLGVVTYEMLAGERPFTGPTFQAILAKIMTEDPRPLTVARRNVPENVAAAVAHALQRIAADRFASAHEFAEALSAPTFTAAAPAVSIRRGGSGAGGARREKWMLYGALGVTVLLAAALFRAVKQLSHPQLVVRYNLVLDSTEAIVPGGSYAGRVALSPDASRLAYVGGPRTQILIKPSNDLHATALAGTEGASTPFFSPDGEYVGFLGEDKVQFAPVNGGPLVNVTDTLTGVAGASWGRDGFIYVDGEGSLGLMRVAAKAGQVPKQFTTVDARHGEFDHLWPDALPGGKGVVFTILFKNAEGKGSSIAVAEVPSGKHHVIINDAMYARFATSGHLLYVTTNKALMVVPFDQNSLKVTGEPKVLVEGMRLGDIGSADLAVSDAGTLLYGLGAAAGKEEFVWVTRDGKTEMVDPDWQDYFWNPSLSPDGTQLAFARPNCCGGSDIWVKRLDRGPVIKISLDRASRMYPTWASDGRSVTFSDSTGGALNVWSKRADGSGQPVLQFHASRYLQDAHWSPDGKWLIFLANGVSGSLDILATRPGVDTAPVPLVATSFAEASPALSPDGKWLAYTSNETGSYEVYVVPFPNTGAAKFAVSAHGGKEPAWSRDGRELFYVDGSANLVAVDVKSAPSFATGRSTTLFPMRGFRSQTLNPEYAVSPDGRRFLMIRRVPSNTPDKLVVVENWFEELAGRSAR